MSVDTNVTGKNLAPYRRLRHDGYTILITPTLVGMVASMRVVAGGVLGRSLRVEFKPAAGAGGAEDDACAL